MCLTSSTVFAAHLSLLLIQLIRLSESETHGLYQQEEKCAEATKRSQRAQKEAVELLRSREKRKEANKRAAAATNHAREQEAAAQEQAKQRKEQNDKAESDRQAAALERRQQMAEREAELSKQAEEVPCPAALRLLSSAPSHSLALNTYRGLLVSHQRSIPAV